MAGIAYVGILIAFLAALVVVIWSHPIVRKVAVKRNIVDNPDARKLQKEPVPVMGGVAVFFGLVTGLCVMSLFFDTASLLPVFVAMSLMLCVGVMDDVSGLSPWLRFVIEIAVVVVLIFTTDLSLNHLHTLWGFYNLPGWLSIPLTIVAVVGMINALNLIDGVDGLSSGFCVIASAAFGIFFYVIGNAVMLTLCAVVVASLLPFFLHNVFGKSSKMFIGDGGSLMMGLVMSSYVVEAIAYRGSFSYTMPEGMGMVAFTMAVMSVPVFDTLRVMIMRIVRGVSPFHPDKTHLHHLFIDLGFSHIGTTLSVLSLNLIVMLAWFLTYKLGGSVDTQFYVVVIGGVSVTAVFYKVMRVQMSHNGCVARLLRRIGEGSHYERGRAWTRLQKVMDLRN